MDIVDGDAERVFGILTAMESMVDVVVAIEVVDPVRRALAASRGRELTAGPPFGSLSWGLRPMRATSLSRGGNRPAPGGLTAPSREESVEAIAVCGEGIRLIKMRHVNNTIN